MSLRVGVDAWNLPNDRRGIGRYVREVVGAWIRLGAEQVRVELIVPERNTFFARRRYLRELAAPLPLRRRGGEQGLDVVWFPWNGMSWVPATPAVATLHDASVFRMPPDAAVAEREHKPFLTAAARARTIITDSQFSKAELVKVLAIEPERIEVIPLGVSDIFFAQPAAVPEREQYVLFVGDTEARKGLSTLLEALQRLPEVTRAALELKIVGSTTRTEDLPSAYGMRISPLGWVDDPMLADLYRRARALIYPSQYEGYGLPIIEAMACGTPVIAASTQSSREAGGEAAIYFPPGDSVGLGVAIGSLLEAPKERTSLIAIAGRAHVSGQTWAATALQTLAALSRGV